MSSGAPPSPFTPPFTARGCGDVALVECVGEAHRLFEVWCEVGSMGVSASRADFVCGTASRRRETVNAATTEFWHVTSPRTVGQLGGPAPRAARRRSVSGRHALHAR